MIWGTAIFRNTNFPFHHIGPFEGKWYRGSEAVGTALAIKWSSELGDFVRKCGFGGLESGISPRGYWQPGTWQFESMWIELLLVGYRQQTDICNLGVTLDVVFLSLVASWWVSANMVSRADHWRTNSRAKHRSSKVCSAAVLIVAVPVSP